MDKKQPIGYPGSMLPKKNRSFAALLAGCAGVLLFLGVFFLYREISAQLSERRASASDFQPALLQPLAQPVQDPTAAPTAAPEDDLVLVNASHPLPSDYQAPSLVCLNDLENGLFTVKAPNTCATKTAADALSQMLSAAQADGLSVWQISAGYRSIEDQQRIWDETYAKYREQNGLSEKKALEATARRVAKPGCSEHHTGLALDITVPGQSFRKTPQCAWLKKHCAQYGFIIRYTEEKERITGISAEPWHIRYVGVEAAQTMLEENLCLEEYWTRYGRSR